jgi:tetratricopeptide (TPR) repeat protein
MRIILALAFVSLGIATFRVNGAEDPLPRTTNAPRIRLAIAGFTQSEPRSEQRRYDLLLNELLMVRLSQAERFQLIERQEIDAAIQEMSLALTQAWVPAESVRVGKLLRADWLLLGSRFDNSGTNTLIVKIVDAQTGVILDLTAVPALGASLEAEAAIIAGFVENAAPRSARTEQRVFLGIGGFENLGVNHRYPELRASLCAYLERTYQGTRFSVVERSMVNPLLTELRLNLAGLTEGAATTNSAQPAFLLVDGTYQSFHEEHTQINLILRVQEVGGGQRLFSLTETPGARLNQRISTLLNGALDGLRRDAARITRKEEAAIQVTRGIERARLESAGDSYNYNYLGGHDPTVGGIEQTKRQKNIAEAMEAFEAALLLDPDNTEAKVNLAICLLDPKVNRRKASREYLAEVIGASTNASAEVKARLLLARSYQGEDDRQALDLLLGLDRDVTHPIQSMRVQEEVLQSAWRLRQVERLTTDAGLRLVERGFLTYCQVLKCPDGYRLWALSPYEMIQKFGNVEWICPINRRDAERYWEDLLPKVIEKHPDLAPHIWAAYVLWRSVQPDGQSVAVPTNVLAQLQWSLDLLQNEPERVVIADPFVFGFANPFLEWSLQSEQYILGETMASLYERSLGKERHVGNLPPQGSRSSKSVEVVKPFYYAGYCKRALGKWTEALAAFEKAQNQAESITMRTRGPWGEAQTQVRAAELIAECQQHLGPEGSTGLVKSIPPPASAPPKQFVLGEPLLKLGRPTVFACDGNQVWLTDGFAPFVYDQRDQTLTDLDWPTSIEHNVTSIQVGESAVWWGTGGSGLVEMDKQTKRCKVYNEADGLLLSTITTLALSKDRLWIGCGQGERGGLCYLDLSTRRLKTLTPALRLDSITNRLAPDLFAYTNAPNSKIWALAPTPADGLWVLCDDMGLRNYSEAHREWKAFHPRKFYDNDCMAVSSDFVAVGGKNSVNGVLIHSIPTHQIPG